MPNVTGTWVVFDLDGTLVDSRPEITVAMKHAWRTVVDDVAFPDDRFRIGPPLADTIAALAPHLELEKREAIAAAFRTSYDASDFSATPPYPGIADVVDALQARGTKLAVATNKRRGPTLAILDRWFPGRFAHVACVDGVFPDDGTRPDANGGPAYMIKAAMLGWLARQAQASIVMIGDTATDIAAARTAGSAVVAVTWGYEDEASLATAAPDKLVRDAAGLFAALERLALENS
jgi:phosphoglycolate phosphatase